MHGLVPKVTNRLWYHSIRPRPRAGIRNPLLNNVHPWDPRFGVHCGHWLQDVLIEYGHLLVDWGWNGGPIRSTDAVVYFATVCLQMEVVCPIIRRVSVRRVAWLPDPRVCAFRLGQCRQSRYSPMV